MKAIPASSSKELSAAREIPQAGQRMPGLDVVRGLAITAVVFYHGLATHRTEAASSLSAWQTNFLAAFEYGSKGVHLFYVLSGFLIAGILLDTRQNTDYYKNFYLRRFLRIVPAYLLMTLVLKVTGTISWPYVAVCLLYICNMSRLLHAAPEYGPYWSLSVEEQFYLTWPFVVRRLSTRNLIRLSIAIVVLSPLLRYGLQFLGPAWSDIHYKTWDVADFFAAGTLLAISVRSQRIRPHLPSLCRVLLFTGFILVLLTEWVLPMAGGPWLKLVAALELSPFVVLFAGMVLLGFLFPGLANSWPGRLAAFLGDISYGLYLCHQFLFNRIDHWLPTHADGSLPVLVQICLRFVLETIVAITIAFLSRRYFEEIFLRMKPKRRESRRQKEFAL